MISAIITQMSDDPRTDSCLAGRHYYWQHLEVGNNIQLSRDKMPWSWSDFDSDPKHACLNLDRQTLDRPAIYGLKCKMRQSFICTFNNEEDAVINHENFVCNRDAVAVTVKANTFVTFFHPYDYGNSMLKCKQAGGVLAEVENVQLKKEFIRNTLIKTDKCQRVALWASDAMVIDKGNLMNRKIENCTSTFGRVCDIDCTKRPNGAEYKCTDYDLMTCAISCDPESLTVGPEWVVCDPSYGWSTLYNRRTAYLPRCLEPPKVVAEILHLLPHLKKDHQGLLFLFDEHFNNKQWLYHLQMAITLVQLFEVGPTFPFGLIIFGKKTRIEVPYETENECDVLWETIKRHKAKEEPSNLLSGLQKAEEQIERLQSGNKSLIILFLVGHDKGDEDQATTLERIKKKHTILAIGPRNKQIMNFDDVASVFMDDLLVFKYELYKTYKSVITALEKTRKTNQIRLNNTELVENKEKKCPKGLLPNLVPITDKLTKRVINDDFVYENDDVMITTHERAGYKKAIMLCEANGATVLDANLVPQLRNLGTDHQIVWIFSNELNTCKAVNIETFQVLYINCHKKIGVMCEKQINK